MKLVINEAARELLQQNRIMGAGANPWALGSEYILREDSLLEPYSHLLAGNIFPREIGAFSYSFSRSDVYLRMGRYCSIALNVVLMGSSHPDHWVSSHPFSHNPGSLQGVRAYLKDVKAERFILEPYEQPDPFAYIGHDVWIGDQAMIKRGVKVGHGAIIGARAVVTKDVPPYAIVGGVPAKVIRYRFTEEIIERLLASQWWRYGPDVLQASDIRDPERFLDRLLNQENRGEIKPLDLTPLKGEALLRASGAL